MKSTNKSYTHVPRCVCPGAPLSLWGQQYLITGADRHVLNYARQHEDQVSPQLLTSLLQHFNEDTHPQEEAQQEQENGNNN